MAMNATALGGLMMSKMDALSDADKADRTKTFKALAEAVIEHIVATAQISGVAAVGLTTAPGGGPVTGTVILPPGSIT